MGQYIFLADVHARVKGYPGNSTVEPERLKSTRLSWRESVVCKLNSTTCYVKVNLDLLPVPFIYRTVSIARPHY